MLAGPPCQFLGKANQGLDSNADLSKPRAGKSTPQNPAYLTAAVPGYPGVLWGAGPPPLDPSIELPQGKGDRPQRTGEPCPRPYPVTSWR